MKPLQGCFLFENVAKLGRHSSGLVNLRLRDLTIGQHLLYLLLWVALKRLPELAILLNHVLHIS